MNILWLEQNSSVRRQSWKTTDSFSQTFPNITTPRARELCQNMFVIVIPLDEQLLAIYQQRHYNTNPLSSVINDDVNGKYNAFCLRARSHFSAGSLSLSLVNKSSDLILAQRWRVSEANVPSYIVYELKYPNKKLI